MSASRTSRHSTLIFVAALALPTSAFAGKDVSLFDLKGLTEFARDGAYPAGQIAASCETVVCNVGDQVVNWQAAMNPDHPFIAYSVYRLKDGRFEQLGRSWAKHTFFVQSQFFCGSCIPAGSQALGVGCADTYTSSHNANQFNLGPREEIDPYTGAWQPCGSYFDGSPQDCLRNGPSGLGPLDHRCVLADSDLGDPSATYCYEAIYVIAGDADTGNNIGSRACSMIWNGSNWFFITPLDGNPLMYGPALANRWLTGGANEQLATISDPGSVYVGSKATDLGGGNWHYEYAVYNYNYSRRIRSFAVPVPSSVTVSNIEFRDGDADPGNDWTSAIDTDCGSITWQTATYDANPTANALVWGTLFNFRFDANVPPATGIVGFDPFLPGGGLSHLSATLVTPDIGCVKGDVNGDGLIDGRDIQSFVEVILNPPCEQSRAYCAANVDGSSGLAATDAAGIANLILVP